LAREGKLRISGLPDRSGITGGRSVSDGLGRKNNFKILENCVVKQYVSSRYFLIEKLMDLGERSELSQRLRRVAKKSETVK
jgi:hypothetical protein